MPAATRIHALSRRSYVLYSTKAMDWPKPQSRLPWRAALGSIPSPKRPRLYPEVESW
jgi:hypothetical protein